MQPKSADQVLDFAIVEEERAAKFYRSLAKRVSRPPMREVFETFAKEEDAHKAKLLGVRAGQAELIPDAKVSDLGLADELPDEPRDPSGEVDYRQALVIAIKAETAAYDLYSCLAAATKNATWKLVLEGLAAEEAKHRARFEAEFAGWQPWMGW